MALKDFMDEQEMAGFKVLTINIKYSVAAVISNLIIFWAVTILQIERIKGRFVVLYTFFLGHFEQVLI